MSEIPEIGKISPEIFNELIFPRLGAKDDKILVGPQNGVDVGIIEIGGKAISFTTDPVFKTLLAQAPNWQNGQPAPKWVAAENLTRPLIESVYIGQKPAKAAMEELARQINALSD